MANETCGNCLYLVDLPNISNYLGYFVCGCKSIKHRDPKPTKRACKSWESADAPFYKDKD